MMSTVIGGAMLPHAPQFFTMPDTEDRAVVAHVREIAADIGERLRALEPDLWIIFSNDHADQFFHSTAPPFTVHIKLGIDVGQTTVAKYMAKSRRPPSQGWKTFLRNHADGVASIDMFIVPTISFRLLYGHLVLRRGESFCGWA